VSRDFNTHFNVITHSVTSDRLINGLYIASVPVVFSLLKKSNYTHSQQTKIKTQISATFSARQAE
jgi:hypothetical protein